MSGKSGEDETVGGTEKLPGKQREKAEKLLVESKEWRSRKVARLLTPQSVHQYLFQDSQEVNQLFTVIINNIQGGHVNQAFNGKSERNLK